MWTHAPETTGSTVLPRGRAAPPPPAMLIRRFRMFRFRSRSVRRRPPTRSLARFIHSFAQGHSPAGQKWGWVLSENEDLVSSAHLVHHAMMPDGQRGLGTMFPSLAAADRKLS